jgi:hypothetical protein
MNFEDNTLTVELSNPELRYEFDYQAKGKMLILPLDAAGLVTVISSEFLSQNFLFLPKSEFQKIRPTPLSLL